MRILLKILLFPVVLVLTVLVAFCRFFCLFSGLILGILAGLLFLIGLLVLFAGRVDGFIGFMVLACLYPQRPDAGPCGRLQRLHGQRPFRRQDRRAPAQGHHL